MSFLRLDRGVLAQDEAVLWRSHVHLTLEDVSKFGVPGDSGGRRYDAPSSSTVGSFVPALVSTAILLAAMWFLLVRPQRRRAMAHAALVARLEVGHRVVTAGGIHGVIEELGDETVRIAIAPGTVITLERRAIARDLDAATLQPDADEGED